MGARWMQQKKLKQKRMRRAWAKGYSMRNTGPMKNPVAVTQTMVDGEPYRSITDVSIRGRAKAATNFWDVHLLQKFRFNPNSNEAIYARTRGLHSDLGGNEVVLARLSQSRRGAGTIQGKDTELVHYDLIERETKHLRLYMGGGKCFFFEIRTTVKGVYRFLSVDYDTKEQAFTAYHQELSGKGQGILWNVIEPAK